MQSNLWLVSAAVTLCTSFNALAQGPDLNGDGAPETLQLSLGFHPDTPVSGRVTVHDGASNGVVFEIDGSVANDGFAFSADFVPDLDGDGIADIAVAAPRAAHTTDRVGRVYIHSGADGQLIRTLFGRRGDRIGFFVGSGRDINADGVPDIEVDGMALVRRGIPADRAFVFCGTTGDMLFDQTYPIPGVQEVLVEPIESWGDLNPTQTLEGGDVAAMLDLISDGAGPESGGDLNADEAVGYDDLDLLVEAVSDGEPPVTESDYVLEDWQWDELKSSMDAWTFLYPEDVITATTHPDEWTGQNGAHQWWIRGRLRSDGKRLVSGWLESPDTLTVDTQGQRVAALGSGTGPGQGCPTCSACVEITDCPDTVKLGEEFTVCADPCGPCVQPLEWDIQEGVFSYSRTGDCVEWLVDFVEQLPGTIIFTVYCEHLCSNGQTVCTRSDSCTVIVEDCTLDLEGCPAELREGESAALTAIADPAGGDYVWSVIEGWGLIEDWTTAGNVASFSIAEGLGCYPSPPTVSVMVDYTKDGCHKQRVCELTVVVDCDNDGVDDRDEGDPSGGNENCPYWGVWDSDGDCVGDGDEINIWGSNPCLVDSDGDDVPDGVEVKLMELGVWTWDVMDVTHPNDPLRDSDHDGLTDIWEIGVPCQFELQADPMDRDTDDDGVWDGCEVGEGWDPQNPNSPSSTGMRMVTGSRTNRRRAPI